MEIFTFVVGIILLGLMVADHWAAYLLDRVNKKAPNNIAIKERARTAKILAVSATLAGVLAIIRLFDLRPPSGIALVILAAILILISIPNINWLYLYFNNKWQK